MYHQYPPHQIRTMSKCQKVAAMMMVFWEFMEQRKEQQQQQQTLEIAKKTSTALATVSKG